MSTYRTPCDSWTSRRVENEKETENLVSKFLYWHHSLQKDMLVRIRKDATREEFEHRYSGGFTRIFPVDDKVRRENYAKLLADAFSTFLSSRAGSLQQEVDRVYKNKYRVCLSIEQWQLVSNFCHTLWVISLQYKVGSPDSLGWKFVHCFLAGTRYSGHDSAMWGGWDGWEEHGFK